MERPPIGQQNGIDYLDEDRYVYNRTGATSVIGDCVLPDVANTSTFVTSNTAPEAESRSDGTRQDAPPRRSERVRAEPARRPAPATRRGTTRQETSFS
jgi:hypothetical protein